MAFGTLAGEFARTKEVPELDAYRFAKMASANGITSASASISTGSDMVGAIDTATAVMDDDEVPYEGRILFVNATGYKLLKSGITRYTMNREDNVNYSIEMYNDMEVVRVPQIRFNTAVTLYDGTSNFGFAPTAGGYPINFMIVHPSAVLPVVKHEIVKVFSPDENQSADAWKFQIRIYHDMFVLDQKLKGVYCHYKPVANS